MLGLKQKYSAAYIQKLCDEFFEMLEKISDENASDNFLDTIE